MSDYTYFDKASGAWLEVLQRGRREPVPDDMIEVEGLWPNHWLIDGVPTPEQDWQPGIAGRRLVNLPPNATVTVGIVKHQASGPEFDLPTPEPFVFVEIVARGYARKRLTVQ